jgi:hypothetical protein
VDALAEKGAVPLKSVAEEAAKPKAWRDCGEHDGEPIGELDEVCLHRAAGDGQRFIQVTDPREREIQAERNHDETV